MFSKKMNVFWLAMVIVLLLMPMASFSGGEKEAAAPMPEKEPIPSENSVPTTITITDAIGREVTIKKPIERIVFTHHAVAESIKIVGVWDMVVGREYTMPSAELYPGLSNLPAVNRSMETYGLDFEKVFELHPDIFLTIKAPMPGMGFDEMVAKLEPEIPVVALLDTTDPAAWASGVRLLGSILDKQEEAEEFITWYKGVERDIEERTTGLSEGKKPRVFFKYPEWTPGQLNTCTKEMSVAQSLFEITGAINIAADLPAPGGWVQNVDPEWLLEQNPDIIVEQIWPGSIPGSFGYEIDDLSVAMAAREHTMNMDVFVDGKAVSEGKVYLYHCDFATTPRFPIAIAYWAKWFHPDLFADLDPQAIHQEYLTRFMCIDYDLKQHGVFVYPEP